MTCDHISLKPVKYLAVFLLLFLSIQGRTQTFVNMAMVDGVDLTPDNIFNYQVQSTSSKPMDVIVTGSIRYRNSPMNISYSLRYTLHQGINSMQGNSRKATWQYSSSAMQDLFLNYKILPTGTYEYCVTVSQVNTSDKGAMGSRECVYHKAGSIFLIDLIDPDDNAKLNEYNPMLTWVANFPFASALTYRIRVAKIQQGQNSMNALSRNNAVYTESNLQQNAIAYPAYATPLIANQPYAWGVDAYFKGILLGSSDVWKFTIIEDTLYHGPLGGNSFVDIKREQGRTQLYALGQIKLKYDLDESKTDTLTLDLKDNNGTPVTLTNNKLPAKYGDNRYTFVFKDDYSLKHTGNYVLTITTQKAGKYVLPFEYINPDLVK